MSDCEEGPGDGLDHEEGAVQCGACGAEHRPGECDLDPANAPVLVTVELWVPAGVDDPVLYVRDRVLRDVETAHAGVEVGDVFLGEEGS